MNDYYGTTDDGTDLYGSPGSFTDENGVPLSIDAGTNINLASGGAITFGGGAAAPGAGGLGQSSSSNSWLSGLSTLASAATNVARTITGTPAPGTPLYTRGVPSGYTLNTQGQLVPVSSSASSLNLGTLLILGLGAWLLFGRKTAAA